ncbi:MAG: hypothetical protein HC905_18310 [Bacteroidales bacterium]|nr:hypothetical protein [Bacteroidales bacterium]
MRFFSKQAVSTTIILLLVAKINAQVSLKEETIEFPTYLINEPDVNPFFFKGESYQGASKVTLSFIL